MKKGHRNYPCIQDTLERQTGSNQKIINDFLDYCRISAGENSIKKIKAKIVQISDIMNKDLNKIYLEDMRSFLMVLNKCSHKTDTKNDTKKVLKRFLKWKYDDWNIRFKELEDIKQKRKPTSEKLSKEELLTPEEIEELIRSADTLRYKAMIILFFETAGRPEEIYKLRWKDINFENKELKLNSGKTGDSRLVVIDQSINRLKLYKQEYPYSNVSQNDFVFPSPRDRTKHITSQTVHSYMRRLGKKIQKHLYPYIFRHTRLNSIRKSLSPDVYQKFAGHSMEVALEHYSHIDNDDVREEMYKLYDIKELEATEREEFREMKKEMLEVKKQQGKAFQVSSLAEKELDVVKQSLSLVLKNMKLLSKKQKPKEIPNEMRKLLNSGNLKKAQEILKSVNI